MIQSNNQKSISIASFNDKGSHTDKYKHSFPQRYAESYVNALDNFFDILEGKKSLYQTRQIVKKIKYSLFVSAHCVSFK